MADFFFAILNVLILYTIKLAWACSLTGKSSMSSSNYFANNANLLVSQRAKNVMFFGAPRKIITELYLSMSLSKIENEIFASNVLLTFKANTDAVGTFFWIIFVKYECLSYLQNIYSIKNKILSFEGLNVSVSLHFFHRYTYVMLKNALENCIYLRKKSECCSYILINKWTNKFLFHFYVEGNWKEIHQDISQMILSYFHVSLREDL